MVSALICTQAELEGDLGDTMLWRQDVDRHFATRLEEARTLALAARPSVVVVDRELPWAERLVTALRQDASTRNLSIVVLARGDFDPAEVELLESGANAILRLPFDEDSDRRLERLVNVPARKEARFSVSFRVDAYANGAGVPEPGLALNLSLHGMLMQTSAALRVGQDVDLEFALEPDPSALRMDGRVVRQASSSNYGIEFTEVEAGAAARLGRFLGDSGLEQA
jgi:CheY-like chemotaxis protein